MKMRRLSVFEVGAMKLITPACFAWHVIKITATEALLNTATVKCQCFDQGNETHSLLKHSALRCQKLICIMEDLLIMKELTGSVVVTLEAACYSD